MRPSPATRRAGRATCLGTLAAACARSATLTRRYAGRNAGLDDASYGKTFGEAMVAERLRLYQQGARTVCRSMEAEGVLKRAVRLSGDPWHQGEPRGSHVPSRPRDYELGPALAACD